MYRPEALLSVKIIFSHRATVSGNKLLPVNEWITLVIGVGYFCSSAAVWGKINRSCTIRAVSLAWGKSQEISEIEGPFKRLLYQRCQLFRVLHVKSLLFDKDWS